MVKAPWKAEPLGNVATLQRGFDLPQRLRKPGTVPIVTSSGIENTHCEAKVKAPGVVTGRYGTIGQVFFVSRDFWPLNTTLYVRDFHGNDPLFVSYLLRTVDFHTHSGKSGVPGVNRNDLHEIVVPVPPTKAEQESIAEVLGDADALIESLERLITKKRRIMRGAMQELLRPKDDWRIEKLESIADVIDPHPSHRAPPEVPNGIPFVGIGDLSEEGEIIGTKIRRVDPSVLDEHRARYDLTEELIGLGRVASIGKVVKLKAAGANYAVSPTLGVIKGRQVRRAYLFHALKSQAIVDQFARIMSGSTRSSVGMIVLRKLDIHLPATDAEQSAISAILTDMDAEIAELEAKLAKAHQIKQGMMQELLTGRIRLV